MKVDPDRTPRAALTLVPSVSHETVKMLEELLSLARAGNVVGLAFCAIFRGLDYQVEIVGETRRHLTLTRGMVCSLDDGLKRLISEESMDMPDGKDFH